MNASDNDNSKIIDAKARSGEAAASSSTATTNGHAEPGEHINDTTSHEPVSTRDNEHEDGEERSASPPSRSPSNNGERNDEGDADDDKSQVSDLCCMALFHLHFFFRFFFFV